MNYGKFFELAGSSALSGAYLLHGGEHFVLNKAVKAAEAMIPQEMRTFNYTIITDALPDAVAAACETLPLLSDKRLVVCRGLSPLADVGRFTSYFDKIPETTALLIVMSETLQERSVLLKYFKALDRDVLFGELSEADIVKWCLKTASSQGVGLDARTAGTLVRLVGTDMSNISNELQKAVDMVGEGGVITAQTLSLCTVGSIEHQVFEMLECFTGGKLADGMRALHAMLEDENEALRIASFLESRFKLMLEGRRLMDGGLSPAAAAAKMEGNRYANGKACTAAKKYAFGQLADMVRRLSSVSYVMMSGGGKAGKLIETIMLGFPW